MLETPEERIKLLRAGYTGKTIEKLYIGHRLRPPFISKSLSIDMRIKCVTLINIHYSLKSSLNSIVSKYKSQLIASIFSENRTPS